MKRALIWLPTIALLAAAPAPSTPAAQPAQDGRDGPREGGRPAWIDARLELRSKSNGAVAAAFAEAAGDLTRSVGRVVSAEGGEDGKLTLATLIGPGEAITKASELRGEYALALGDPSEGPLTRVPVRLAGVVPRHDLALLRFDPADAPAGVRPVTLTDDDAARVGDFLISVGPERGNLAYGVRSVGPIQIPPSSAFLGIGMDAVRGEGRAGRVVVTRVTPASAAARAGIEVGDLLVEIDGVEVRGVPSVAGIVNSREVGQTVRVRLLRDGEPVTVRAQLGSRPRGSLRAIQQNQLGGALSARASGFPEVIQHDAVLGPADMGGPVVTLDGEVVGLNIARAGRVETYALPTKVLRAVLDDLRAGRFAPSTRPALEPGEGPAEQAPMLVEP